MSDLLITVQNWRETMPVKEIQLDPTQRLIYQYLRRYKSLNDGIPPTVREIAHGLGMSSTAIQWQLNNLERLGLIKRVGFRSRSIKLIGGKYVPPLWEG